MFQGKAQGALNLLSHKTRGELLHLSDLVSPNYISSQSVKEAQMEKHPSAHAASLDVLIQSEPSDINHVIFDAIDASGIRLCALSKRVILKAIAWRNLCTYHKSASHTLYQSLAQCVKRLCTEFIDAKMLSPLLSCRLIALNKNPGVRPIGISEIPWQILAKAVL